MLFIYYISSVCQRQYTSSKLCKKNVCFAGFMNDIYSLFFNVTNNNFSFQMASPCRFCSPITIYIPQFFSQISYHDLGPLSFLISCYEFFWWSLIVYILPWCCACISCETNKLTTLYYCLTSEQEPQRIICTINFLCVSNLHNTSTCIYRQSSLNMLTYFVSVTANQSIQYMLTNRKIPYFKQFIHVHLLHHWNSLSLSKSGTLTSMFEILHQTLRAFTSRSAR